MDNMKICPQFANKCIREFTSMLKIWNRHPNNSSRYDVAYYDIAKDHETKTRNLQLSLSYYCKAAQNGEKLNSCIKDFASVLHQGGYTQQAILFLENMRPAYKGDSQKYEKLILNLSVQLRPTGKHQYRKILIDLVDIRLSQARENQIREMFTNPSRIKIIKFYEKLNLQKPKMEGRFVVIEFDSFSAAKKTMQTFKSDQWFGVNKYWLDIDCCIVAQSTEPKTDFERGVFLNKGKIERLDNIDISELSVAILVPDFQKILGIDGLELVNQVSVYLIQNYRNTLRRDKSLD